MATNFKITRGESRKYSDDDRDYVVEKEFKKELRKVAGLEKELKKHEKTSIQDAHPMPHMRTK